MPCCSCLHMPVTVCWRFVTIESKKGKDSRYRVTLLSLAKRYQIPNNKREKGHWCRRWSQGRRRKRRKRWSHRLRRNIRKRTWLARYNTSSVRFSDSSSSGPSPYSRLRSGMSTNFVSRWCFQLLSYWKVKEVSNSLLSFLDNSAERCPIHSNRRGCCIAYLCLSTYIFP